MINIRKSKYPYRCLARMIVEAATPLAIGSGDESILTDRLVVRDINGLPFLPGTSIAGVMRHSLAEEDPALTEKIFGFQKKQKTQGSVLTISEGKIMASDGVTVVDGILSEPLPATSYYNLLQEGIVRQHARIGHKGATVKHGKFDEEVVPKGARFCFEVEMLASDGQEIDSFKHIMEMLGYADFRLGGGTRNGFGQIQIVNARIAIVDLRKEDERNAYLTKSSDLNESSRWSMWKDISIESRSERYDTYTLSLQPLDFFHFGSGMGDGESDAAPLKEQFIDWTDDQKASVKQTYKILPASSLKGVLSHRTAYHYNKLKGIFANDNNDAIASDNQAVRNLFGCSGEGNDEKRQRGKVLFSDLIQYENLTTKPFNHVAISQFTGGALQGKLYNENTIVGRELKFEISILVPKEGLDKVAVESFEKAMRDVCESRLPLGGMTNRGHGLFKGVLMKNDVQL